MRPLLLLCFDGRFFGFGTCWAWLMILVDIGWFYWALLGFVGFVKVGLCVYCVTNK